MKECWNGISINDIEKIGKYHGQYNQKETTISFDVFFKDGSITTMSFIAQGNNDKYGIEKHLELIKLFNEHNCVCKSYKPMNSVFISDNNRLILFGQKCRDENGESKILTIKEIKDFTENKEVKILENNWRQLALVVVFKIEENEIDRPIPQSYIDQLIYMGHDISKLEHKLIQ